MSEATPLRDMDAEEWRLRRELADFYHVVDYLGWTELIFNHISVRVPGPQHQYLVNPFGLNYSEVTPANLLKVGVDGRLIEPSRYPANPAGFALHGAIHESRADVTCIAHTHTTAVSAIAMKRGGIDHNNFYGAQLDGRVAYHDFEGITLFADERPRMVASLGDKHVLVLRNHGVAVCERDIPWTFALLWTVQRAAEIQCQAAAISGENVELGDAVRSRCRASAVDFAASANLVRLMFDATVRRMRAARDRAPPAG
ncbi:MAG TPA: class II aldolase/adducin family protein [Steroidobacteraceae bacterium]|nr:class II aldolase/adducin family protein [Steroidobacteraceae bacterium]